MGVASRAALQASDGLCCERWLRFLFAQLNPSRQNPTECALINFSSSAAWPLLVLRHSD
jgi:hypothetical protein